MSEENKDIEEKMTNEESNAAREKKSEEKGSISHRKKKKSKAEEMVTIKLFKDNKDYKDDVVVGVNGKMWKIQRGVEVKVPAYVAEVIERSQEQDKQAADNLERLVSQYKEKTKEQQ